MTDAEKLAEIKRKLDGIIFEDETDDDDGYWASIESHADNATDVICDWDRFHKKLLEIINEE